MHHSLENVAAVEAALLLGLDSPASSLAPHIRALVYPIPRLSVLPARLWGAALLWWSKDEPNLTGEAHTECLAELWGALTSPECSPLAEAVALQTLSHYVTAEAIANGDFLARVQRLLQSPHDALRNWGSMALGGLYPRALSTADVRAFLRGAGLDADAEIARLDLAAEVG